MSSLAYEQLLCNSNQEETQELCHDISQSDEQLLCNSNEEEKQEVCHEFSQYNENKSRKNQDERSSQFVFNIWWTVFLTVIVVTLGISVLYQMFPDSLSQALDYTGQRH